MPAEMKPSSPQNAPDPSNNYERSHPERESPAGKLTRDEPPVHQSADSPTDAVSNQTDSRKNIVSNERDLPNHLPAPEQPDHSMKEEEPLGSDLAPQNISDPEQKRHPRIGGKGGTPDAGENARDS